MYQETIQYGYALNESKHLVDIDHINKEQSQGHTFYCPHCHEKMYPTFGPKYVHHFRHLGQRCQYSNYLHELAKTIFKEEFERCLDDKKPFLLELHTPTKCDRDCLVKKECKKYDTITVDLSKLYTSITLEERIIIDDHSRRPDILLKSDDGQELWIEIWVKHETPPDKQKEGHIVEIKINSENDLTQFHNHYITQSQDKGLIVRTFNVEYDDTVDAVQTHKHNCHNCHAYVARPSITREVHSHSSYKQTSNYYQKTTSVKPFPQEPVMPSLESTEWINLGLPSGTLWAKTDIETHISFNYALRKYGINVPSKEQVEELEKNCSIEWNSETKTIIMKGPNGNSISFYCPDKYTHFWLNTYYRRPYACCYHLAEGKYLWINDKEDISLIGLHLVRKQ